MWYDAEQGGDSFSNNNADGAWEMKKLADMWSLFYMMITIYFNTPYMDICGRWLLLMGRRITPSSRRFG